MKTPTENRQPLLLNDRQAALALSLSASTLYRLRREGRIPYVKFGRAVRYDVSALEAWKRSLAITAEPSLN